MKNEINELIKQMTELIKTLNSEYVKREVEDVYENIDDVLKKVNNELFFEGFKNLYNNINDLVNHTKVNIDVDDNNKLYQVLLLSEIFLIFIMIIIFILFIIYLYEKYQKYKEGLKKPYKRISSNLDCFLEKD
jgi:predicted PurR-regulated permease PerM